MTTRGGRSRNPDDEEESMPIYEYRCQKCQHEFTLVMCMSEHDKSQVVCPQCQSRQVIQQNTVYYARAGRIGSR